MIVYAIRQISTGLYLSAYGRRRGHTRAEPVATKPPRLFLKYQHAKSSLDWYVAGQWTEKRTYSYEGAGLGGEIEECELELIPNTARDSADFEIVKLLLSEVTQPIPTGGFS